MYVVYMYLMYIYTGTTKCTPSNMLNNPCSMDPFFFKMKHQQIFKVVGMGWGGRVSRGVRYHI